MKLWHRSQRGSLESTPPARRGTSILADLRPWWLRVKEWYTSSYRTCDTGDDEPSWVSARRANLARCAFYRLPEELVLQILSSLDDISKRIALLPKRRKIRYGYPKAPEYALVLPLQRGSQASPLLITAERIPIGNPDLCARRSYSNFNTKPL
ncbi:hypothetical protein GQ53DRAFT_763237 [Thozetella sp. PMI_491]|nr:hypothetical protein GQ53DRAFT_763237 [Thozetella sp. PMI_491]